VETEKFSPELDSSGWSKETLDSWMGQEVLVKGADGNEVSGVLERGEGKEYKVGDVEFDGGDTIRWKMKGGGSPRTIKLKN